MNLDQITTKCWILALFIRDDGERLLLGDGWFDFKDSLQHFQPNSIANDIVELQGTDGQLLAGQVRRSASQSFDGYIGDALTSKTETENRRRQFIQFFRTRRHYKVIYIFPDGTAIQRRMGYLTDAPSVPEMWQKFPEYHVALNFEDVNYYEYAEDAQGDEIYAHDSLVKLISVQSGGLVWDGIGAVSHGYTWLDPQTVTGDYITVTDSATGSPLTLSQLTGNAEQTTYSGINIFKTSDSIWTGQSAGRVTYSATNDDFTFKRPAGADFLVMNGSLAFKPNTTYSILFDVNQNTMTDSFRLILNSTCIQSSTLSIPAGATGKFYGKLVTMSSLTQTYDMWFYCSSPGNTLKAKIMLLEGDYTSETFPTYEPYVGGTASPNPDYPQTVNTVTGEQTVKVEGKNLFDKDMTPVDAWHATKETTQSGIELTSMATGGVCYVYYEFPFRHSESVDATVSFQKTGSGFVNIYFRDENNNVTKSTSNQTSTFSLSNIPSTTTKVQIYFYGDTSASGKVTTYDNIQLELGSATAYEPYQGQEFPIDLYEPNLFDISKVISDSNGYLVNNGDGTLSVNGFNRSGNSPYNLADYCPNLQVGDEVVLNAKTTGTRAYIYLNGSNYQWNFGTKRTITATDLTSRVGFYSTASGTINTISNIRIAKPIELAGVGEIQSDGLPKYHDTIKPIDGKWYIEKQVGKLTWNGSENWLINNSGTQSFYYVLRQLNLGLTSNVTTLMSNYGSYGDVGNTSNRQGIMMLTANNNEVRIRYGSEMALADWKAKLASLSMVLYYALATPTTTEITDETLLAQLNFVASLYGGVNNISLVPSSGAQGEMTLNYYADVDTTGAGYEWEAGEGGGPTIVQVIGVDNAQPIWTVTGPATNPTLTNITTVQTITWNGTVPNGQKLIIDMANQTATLAGANVYEFITGSWITLRPGANKLTYSAQGADQASQIQWNGVIG